MSAETCKLLVKNMPCNMEELAQLIQELKLVTPRCLHNFGRRRALLEYADAPEAERALKELKGLDDLLDKPLRVSPFGSTSTDPKKSCSHKSSQTKGNLPQQQQKQLELLGKYVPKPKPYDFNQPPPSHLHYNYPPINAEILKEISRTLMSDKRFYHQVLHLMNRMNLEPPFKKRVPALIRPQVQLSVGTQTEQLPASETESELESEEEQPKRKRLEPLVVKESQLKRTRQMLQQAAAQQATAFPTLESQKAAPSFAAPKIELKLPQALTLSQPGKLLTLEELQALPLFKNYQEGAPSNKLYIKNLDKQVTEQQLRELYTKYTKSANNLEIKVMQQGRMKGQAFVTFQQTEATKIAQALKETNGLMWQQKPMIVCYGKQQA